MTDLTEKRCIPCEGGVPALQTEAIQAHLASLNAWELTDNAGMIFKQFQFKDFHDTMAYVNQVAEIAHAENHHPDLRIGYNHCHITYTTHAIGGLTENDFICAAKVDALHRA